MNSKQQNIPIQIILAEDDTDDRSFFEKALREIPILNEVKMFENGEVLMDYLLEAPISIPDIIFLDISMPRKTGIECLIEIKNDKKLEHVPVIIFTTSFTRGLELEMKLSNTLFAMGAQDYIRKPAGFKDLKLAIHQAIVKHTEKNSLKEEGGIKNE
jgi:response regulator RpfG family c-di-GMP phosphodiesterase